MVHWEPIKLDNARKIKAFSYPSRIGSILIKRIKIWIFLTGYLLSFVWTGQQALAATQGTLGTTSTATAVITVVIPPNFKISGMQDLALGSYSGSGAMAGDRDICVYSNGTGSYRVLITDDSTLSPSGFSAQNSSATASIPYTVRWNGTTGTAGNTNVNYNTPRAYSGANTLSTDCSVGGLSANIRVNFTQANLRSVPGDAYSTTITVVIEP